MKYFDVCTKMTYEKDGEQKVSWLKAGTMRTNDEGQNFIELAMFPTTPFYVFPQKEKEGAGA